MFLLIAAKRIANKGDGSTPNSCMSCDPTHGSVRYFSPNLFLNVSGVVVGSCPDGCQNRIDTMYVACDGVCLPDGYFFDPRKLCRINYV